MDGEFMERTLKLCNHSFVNLKKIVLGLARVHWSHVTAMLEFRSTHGLVMKYVKTPSSCANDNNL
jgi:hypothetical protein